MCFIDFNYIVLQCTPNNTSLPGQNGRNRGRRHFKWIFLYDNVWISIKISLKFVSKGSINNGGALVQIMAWRRTVDKPLSGPMVSRFTDTLPQWVKRGWIFAKIHTINTSLLAHEGEGDIFCEFKLSCMFCLSHRRDVYMIMYYGTAP